MTPTESHYYGIDIGGSKIELVAVDAALATRHRQRIDTPTRDFDAFVEAVAGLVEAADRALGLPVGDLPPVGFGMPGVVDPVSGCQLSSNVPALNGRQVEQALQARLGRPLAMGNDCHCFALSEANGGAAQDYLSMFGAILGTGAGGGYCLGGRLAAGYNRGGGEWGHWTVPATLLARHALPLLGCPCGLQGCLERYVSGGGLAMLYRHLAAEGQAAERPADAAEIVRRAGQGEGRARDALDVHLDLLAHGLAGLILVLDPHVLVLGGGLSRLDHLYRELPAAVARHLFRGVRVPPILPPAFGDAGGARGAALLARQRSRS